MRRGLSALIFSSLDADQAVELMREMLPIVDQIVLVDSNKGEKSEMLKRFARQKGKGKIDFYHTNFTFGYADPLRMYGLSKCKNDWVIYLDPDERPNQLLKINLRRIVDGATVSAFAIKRFEGRGANSSGSDSGRSTTLHTWQIRLYDKTKVTYGGMIHEQPKVEGKIERLPEEFYMLHLRRAVRRFYNRMEIFDRYTYDSFNKRIMNYVKVTMPEGTKVDQTSRGKIVRSLLDAYEALGFKNPRKEISNFDYFSLLFWRDLAYCISSRDLGSFLPMSIGRLNYATKELPKIKNSKDGQEIFEIAQIIQKRGIIDFLGLDRDSTIRRINKGHYQQDGIDLLIRLLKEQYRKTRQGI